MPIAFAGLAGLLLGPLLHGWAVEAGADQSFSLSPACPRHPSQTRGGITRCGCGRLRWRELVTALVVGAMFAAFASSVGWRPVLAAHLVMVALTAMLIITDLDHFRIPNRLLYPGSAVCLGLLTIGAGVEDEWLSLRDGLVAAAIYFALLLAVFLAARGDGFGFGDVKLAALLGLFTGYQALRLLASALLITAILGGVPAIVMLAMGRGRKTAIPYGPPLILGAWGAILLAHRLVGK
ncbi:MAG: prepilin peptidase [Actinomycetota bacterium]